MRGASQRPLLLPEGMRNGKPRLLLLFDDGSSQIVAKLRGVDVDDMTPDRALKILRKLRREAGGE